MKIEWEQEKAITHMELKKMTGKFLAYVLRHNPAAVGIELDENGWAKVDELLVGVQRSGRLIDITALEEIVATDDKHRFSFNEDKSKIRANQGHSIDIDLGLEEKTPPDILYHGTAEKYIDNIKQNGIQKRNRQYVHLSSDKQTAIKVGSRHGKPVIFKIDAKQMVMDGFKFYLSENGVWLTDYVSFKYFTKIIFAE